MYTRKKYSIKDMLLWTRWELVYFLLLASLVAFLYDVVGWYWIKLPWTPIALIGTAVAFLIGFQNNAAYGRAWEARKIWGGIVNESRSWTMMVSSMVTNEYADQPVTEAELQEHIHRLVERQIAWLTALRFAMRSKRSWEVFTEHRTNLEWYDKVCIPERDGSLEVELKQILPLEEAERVLKLNNPAAGILKLQSEHLLRLKQQGLIWEFSFLELESVLRELFALQGKSERIKNFPYPRQYATLSYDIVRIFILLLPFGVIPEFSVVGYKLAQEFPEQYANLARYFIWLGVPFTAVVSWVFNTMQRIGIVGENPFEGSANDVPISTIARGIEIDLRQLIDQPADAIPAPLPVMEGVQM